MSAPQNRKETGDYQPKALGIKKGGEKQDRSLRRPERKENPGTSP